MKEPHEAINEVNSKEKFLSFVESLKNDLEVNPQNWENITLKDYLVALHSWTADMEGYYINTNQQVPTSVSWKVFADILMAAKMYEG